ncbi:hypothetical protein GALMADRAFT_267567 [Galerina marginata CBS 339.88]|uniref:Uncharacterized protein n=1 Tax=Galerina marginata (strain CBS 339.88) TaxID=685588 RepID=A0A067TBZ5_GALM3|nr:hypothetical protein GALMADRAFT_267567 [Galerina marginata CBS 339.88]
MFRYPRDSLLISFSCCFYLMSGNELTALLSALRFVFRTEVLTLVSLSWRLCMIMYDVIQAGCLAGAHGMTPTHTCTTPREYSDIVDPVEGRQFLHHAQLNLVSICKQKRAVKDTIEPYKSVPLWRLYT